MARMPMIKKKYIYIYLNLEPEFSPYLGRFGAPSNRSGQPKEVDPWGFRLYTVRIQTHP